MTIIDPHATMRLSVPIGNGQAMNLDMPADVRQCQPNGIGTWILARAILLLEARICELEDVIVDLRENNTSPESIAACLAIMDRVALRRRARDEQADESKKGCDA